MIPTSFKAFAEYFKVKEKINTFFVLFMCLVDY